jgi:squalene-hopene/tetraprenyl-beta-curcumene cyclase
LDFQLAVRVHASIQKGLAFLIAGQQADGGWEAFGKSNPAITSLVIKALAQDADYGPNHPAVRRGLESILRHVQRDGGIYVDGEEMPNYHTSVALMALAAMKDSALGARIKEAQAFLKKLQWDEGEGLEASNAWYGGAGYGKSKRPDLSNTQFMLEALHDSGLSADDPVYQKAMVFVSRCQMLDKTNDQPFARESGDGGFVYSPANGGESKAGTEVEADRPRLRSYGSMTYAGFKSLLYAKVDRDDPRVKAAVDWIRRYYTLDHNPNMPGAQSREGLYYYFYIFARAMRAWGQESVNDAGGLPHSWRNELCEKLLSLQRDDGSWVNEADRWYEGNPHLVTAYAILAMQTALER